MSGVTGVNPTFGSLTNEAWEMGVPSTTGLREPCPVAVARSPRATTPHDQFPEPETADRFKYIPGTQPWVNQDDDYLDEDDDDDDDDDDEFFPDDEDDFDDDDDDEADDDDD